MLGLLQQRLQKQTPVPRAHSRRQSNAKHRQRTAAAAAAHAVSAECQAPANRIR